MSRVVFRRPDRDLVLRRLQAWARGQLARRPEVRRVVLIGSLARGDWSARSDADVVIVVAGAPAGPGPFRGCTSRWPMCAAPAAMSGAMAAS